MWDALFSNIPATIITIVAILICGAEIIKAITVWRNKFNDKYKEKFDSQQELTTIKDTQARLNDSLDQLNQRLDVIVQRIEDLTLSDMHDIKSWIVDQYHKFFIEQKWIDAFHAESINRRYEDYKKEGGNSYVDTLIERIHTLPVDPPDDMKNQK